MSVSSSSSQASQSVSNQVLQQLLANSNSYGGSGLTPGVLKALLNPAGSTTDGDANTASSSSGSTAAALPTEVSQALGELLSGSGQGQSEANLQLLQSYFKAHPSALAALQSQLQGAGTYGADGSLGTAQATLLATLQDKTASKAERKQAVAQFQTQLSQSQDPLITSLNGGSLSGSGSTFSLLS